MKTQDKFNIGFLILLVIIVVFIARFSPTVNDTTFSFQGITDVCQQDCNSITVKNMYSGSSIESTKKVLADYGGTIVPSVCDFTIEMGDPCEEFQVTSLADYRISTSTVLGQEKAFQNYWYLGRYGVSKYTNKIYFLYRISTPDTQWVYEQPLKIVSYDTETSSVHDEGYVDVENIAVNEMYVSPRGTYIVIVDGNESFFIPAKKGAGITAYNLKNKVTREVARVDEGDKIQFVDWIDDTRFIFKIIKSAESGHVVFKMGAIE